MFRPPILAIFREVFFERYTLHKTLKQFLNTVKAAYYNRGCYQSAIVITISGLKTLHLKSIKNKPFIIINLSIIVIKLQIIPVHI
jgi:hypothetical protein